MAFSKNYTIHLTLTKDKISKGFVGITGTNFRGLKMVELIYEKS